jgi:hypothetical protein
MPVSIPFRERADFVGGDFAELDLGEYVAQPSASVAVPWREESVNASG